LGYTWEILKRFEFFERVPASQPLQPTSGARTPLNWSEFHAPLAAERHDVRRTPSEITGAKMSKLTAKTEFEAVDLDVRSRRSLAPLLDEWPWAQTPGRVGNAVPRWLLVTPRGVPRTADQFVKEFAQLVDKLPLAAKRCWNQASSRTFDIGIQAGLTPDRFDDVRLSPDSLRHLSRLRASILVTVYAPSTE
jgi:hypothetical protein